MDCFKKGMSLTALAAAMMLAGCASNKVENKPLAAKIASEYPVYAKLSATPEGRYYFSEFSFLPLENAVHLNTLTHNIRTESVTCEDNYVNMTTKQVVVDPECKQETLAIFRSSGQDGESMALNTVGAAVALLSYGMKSSKYRTISFDEALYEKALGEALAAQPREQLIAEFNSIYQQSALHFANKKTEFDNRWRELSAKLLKALVVNDKSQLHSGKPEVYIYESNAIRKRADTNLRWASSSDLTTQLQAAANSDYEKARLILRCDYMPSFQHTSSGCEQGWGTSDVLTVKPVTYNIDKAKGYRYVPVINASNAHITAVSDKDGVVTIGNQTDSFITIESLSLYIGDDIQNISDLNLPMPPRSVNKDLTLSKFSIFGKTTLTNVRKADLAKRVNVGVAMKYQIADTNKTNTLFKTEDVKIQDLPGWVM